MSCGGCGSTCWIDEGPAPRGAPASGFVIAEALDALPLAAEQLWQAFVALDVQVLDATPARPADVVRRRDRCALRVLWDGNSRGGGRAAPSHPGAAGGEERHVHLLAALLESAVEEAAQERAALQDVAEWMRELQARPPAAILGASRCDGAWATAFAMLLHTGVRDAAYCPSIVPSATMDLELDAEARDEAYALRLQARELAQQRAEAEARGSLPREAHLWARAQALAPVNERYARRLYVARRTRELLRVPLLRGVE